MSVAHIKTENNSARALLITRFSLSKKSAIGIQTELYLSALTDSFHLHWEQRDLKKYKNSICLNNVFVSRFHKLANSAIAKITGLNWWRNNSLMPQHFKTLLALKDKIDIIYAAPINIGDVYRMNQIISILDRPYVVHLWDILDEEQIGNPEFKHLLDNSLAVFCLTAPMMDAIQNKSDKLLFCREAAAVTALPVSPDKPIRIVVIGDVTSYKDGVEVLIKACQMLKSRNVETEIVYIGPSGAFKRLPENVRSNIVNLGFMKSDADRDLELSRCHFGFMPGPKSPPATDTRSRYSIPSKVLDYFAAGLPLLGTVHPESATGRFLEELHIDSVFFDNGQDLASFIEHAAGTETWNIHSEKSKKAFETTQNPYPPLQLRDALNSLHAGA